MHELMGFVREDLCLALQSSGSDKGSKLSCSPGPVPGASLSEHFVWWLYLLHMYEPFWCPGSSAGGMFLSQTLVGQEG